MIVLLDGAFIAEEAARIAPADRGFTLADGVFDTLLAEDGVALDAPAHFARLQRHAALLGIQLPQSPAALAEAALALLQRNGFLEGRHAIRTTLTRGSGVRGLAPPDNAMPTLLMRAATVPGPASDPLRLIVASSTRRNEHSPLSRIKSLNYGDNLLALLEAKRQGVDDAILLNTAGNAACATTSNIFIREQGRLATPLLADGVLDGITRQKLLMENGATEETITVARLLAAEEIILTNSVAGLRTARLLR